MDSVSQIIKQQRDFFNTGATKDINFRINALKYLKMALKNYETELLDALKKDLNKSKTEAYMTEIGICISEINYMIKNLKRFSKPKKVKTPKAYIGSSSYIYPEPLGVTLIIAPWNYPVQLSIAPLIGSIAAGNCCVIETSNMAINSANVIRKMINKSFKNHYIYVLENTEEMPTRILEERFDYIFFTGSQRVGKIVMNSASKNLTPVTLELGGKSPCIVTPDADLEMSAKRICFGKFSNAGQTCVAPDYLLVHKNISQNLISELKKNILSFYGSNPKQSNDFGKIINMKHFERLKLLLQNQNIIFGGDLDSTNLFISPTLILNPNLDSNLMNEEIFGPILPIIEYSNLNKIISFINSKEKPLALYLFSTEDDIKNKILNNTSSGGVCINDTLIHITTNYLPFGGVGSSGMGSYHGEASFKTFSHYKSILKSSLAIDTKIYPPYKIDINKLKRLMKFL